MTPSLQQAGKWETQFYKCNTKIWPTTQIVEPLERSTAWLIAWFQCCKSLRVGFGPTVLGLLIHRTGRECIFGIAYEVTEN